MSFVPTIDGIFDQIQNAIDVNAFLINVTYNDKFGFPENVIVDFELQMADEELYLSVSNFTSSVATKAEAKRCHNVGGSVLRGKRHHCAN